VNKSTELKVKTIMARVMRIDIAKIADNSSTDTIDTWDSLNHMKLVLALEEEFEIAFDDAQIEHMITFAKVISLISQLKG
jgi:acyl carrier protein